MTPLPPSEILVSSILGPCPLSCQWQSGGQFPDWLAVVSGKVLGMASMGYIDFRDSLIARHQNPVTSGLSIVGDVLLVAAIPVAVARHSFRTWVSSTIAGYAIAVVAHLFQRGTLKSELSAFARHPIWGVKAETERVGRLLHAAS